MVSKNYFILNDKLMNFIDLFPEYPDISSDSFYRSIFIKKEFNDLQYEEEEYQNIRKFYKHQLFVSRFISNWTLYQSLILIHETGTGKSGAAAAVFDGLKKYNENLMTLYITNNDSLLENFKEEIFRLSQRLYDPSIEEINMEVQEFKKSYEQKRNAILQKAGITFTTYYKFASDYVKEKNNKNFAKQWENQLIIMDEVHHLVSHDIEKEKEDRTVKKKIKISPIIPPSLIIILNDFENLSKKKDVHDFSKIANPLLKNELQKIQDPNYINVLQKTFEIVMKNFIVSKKIPFVLTKLLQLIAKILQLLSNNESNQKIFEQLKSDQVLFKKCQDIKSNNKILTFIIHYTKNIANNIDSNLKPYDEIYEFVHSLNYKKMILLTATPMRNSPSEIAPLINLALDKKSQLPIGDTFISNYFNKKNTQSNVPLLTWKTDKEQEFQQSIKGLISFVKIKVDVKKVYMGKIYKPMKYFKLYVGEMGDTQTKGYKIAFDLDTQKKKSDSSFYNNCQQASLFVFPDFSFGIKKTYKYIDVKGGFNSQFVKDTGLSWFEKKKIENINENDHKILNKNLTIIKNLSITYYNIIKQIIENRNQKVYVYCDKINGSGIKLCIALLTQFFGYTRLKFSKNFKKNEKIPRCIYLHESENETTKSDLPKLIKECFNDPMNLFGDYVQVIFGTDKTREGISLKGIQQIHICSGDWNFGKIFQAIGRGIRLKSHIGLPEDTKVQIFLHCAVPPKNSIKHHTLDDNYDTHHENQNQEYTSKQLNQSIDFFQYYRSELKDMNIKKIDYTLLRSAVDCQINKRYNIGKNLIDKKDNTTECMYKPCEYTCEGFEDMDQHQIDNLPIDFTTYNLYYIQEKKKKLMEFILSLFYHKTIYHLEEINNLANIKKFTPHAVLESLVFILETPVLIPFYDGRKLYLNQINDVFFLSEDRFQNSLNDKNQLWIASYSDHPSFKIEMSFDSFLNNWQNKKFPLLCKTLQKYYSNDKKEEALQIIDLIPDTFYFKFMEFIVQNTNDFITWLKLVLNKILINKDNEWFLSKNKKIYVFNKQESKWKLTKQTNLIVQPKQETTMQDHESDEFTKKYIQNKIVYGFVENKEFKIRDVSNSKNWKNKKTTTKGKVCTSFDFWQLLYFLYTLQPTIPEKHELKEYPLLEELYEKLIKKESKILKTEFMISNYANKFMQAIGKTSENISKDDMLFFLFFYRGFGSYHYKKPDFCQYLHKIFKTHDLITKPPLK